MSSGKQAFTAALTGVLLSHKFLQPVGLVSEYFLPSVQPITVLYDNTPKGIIHGREGIITVIFQIGHG